MHMVEYGDNPVPVPCSPQLHQAAADVCPPDDSVTAILEHTRALLLAHPHISHTDNICMIQWNNLHRATSGLQTCAATRRNCQRTREHSNESVLSQRKGAQTAEGCSRYCQHAMATCCVVGSSFCTAVLIKTLLPSQEHRYTTPLLSEQNRMKSLQCYAGCS